MRRAILALSLCLLATSCGGGSTTAKVASAIETKQVAGLFARATGLVAVYAPTCTKTAPAGNYTCTGTPTFVLCPKDAGPSLACASPTAPTKIWIYCYPNKKGGDALFCQRENAPAGTNVFVTRAQRAAAKTVSWKCMRQQGGPNGLDLGPVTISIAKTYGPVETEPESMTKARAQALARALHLPFHGVCR